VVAAIAALAAVTLSGSATALPVSLTGLAGVASRYVADEIPGRRFGNAAVLGGRASLPVSGPLDVSIRVARLHYDAGFLGGASGVARPPEYHFRATFVPLLAEASATATRDPRPGKPSLIGRIGLGVARTTEELRTTASDSGGMEVTQVEVRTGWQPVLTVGGALGFRLTQALDLELGAEYIGSKSRTVGGFRAYPLPTSSGLGVASATAGIRVTL
jgi:hypothetical protein